MSEGINLNSKEKEESSFKEYIHGVINELKEQRHTLYKDLSGIKTSFDYLEHLNADDDEAVIYEKARLEAERDDLEEEKEILRNKILFYGILENANNPEEVVSEYRDKNKIDGAEAEAVLGFLKPKTEEIEKPEIVISENFPAESAEEIKENITSAEIETVPDNQTARIKSEDEEDENEDDESVEKIIAGLPEEKKAILNKAKENIAETETSAPLSFLKYREQMKKERKADFLKNDIKKMEEEAEKAKNNREYREFARIEKDIKKKKRQLWWYLSPVEQEVQRSEEKEQREAAQKQYKKTMKGAGISASENIDYSEEEELRPSEEELALSSQIEKLNNKAAAEYRKIVRIKNRIDYIQKTLYFLDSVDNAKKTSEEIKAIEEYRIKLDKLSNILAEKFAALRELFWHINYLKIEIAKIHNEKEWERDKYMGSGHVKDDIGPEQTWVIVNKNLAKKNAFESAFDKLGGPESAKKKLGLIEENKKAKSLNGSKALLKKKEIKKASARGGASKNLNA